MNTDKNEDGARLTICDPKALQAQIKGGGVCVDVVGDVLIIHEIFAHGLFEVLELTRNIHPRILPTDVHNISDIAQRSDTMNTYALSTEVQLLALQLREHLQELLHEANQLRGQIIFVLEERV